MSYGIRYPLSSGATPENNYHSWRPSSNMEVFMDGDTGKHIREFIPGDYVVKREKK